MLKPVDRNAYPWTAGTFYAGVPQGEIECAGPRLWDRYHELLESEYGIADSATLYNIIHANDSARSHEEAIEQVQFVLGGGNLAELLRARFPVAGVLAAAAPQNLEDDGGACGALVG